VIALLLLGCGEPAQPRPEGVPPGVAFLRYAGNDLKLDDKVIAPWKGLREGPQERPFVPLSAALEARLTKEAGTWIALPGNASWGDARRAIHTVFQADAGPIWLGALGSDKAFGPLDNLPSGRPFPACPDGPIPVVGVGERLSIELHADDLQTWADATLRFKPMVRLPGEEPVLAELLDRRCWQPTTCSVLGSPAEAAACEQGLASAKPVPDRVEVGGKHGCLVPFAKAFDHDKWAGELTRNLARLGLHDDVGVMIMADEQVELSAILAMIEGLEDHGQPTPQLGMLRMGSGDQAGLCDAPVRTEEQAKAAAARWFGAQLSLGGPR